MPGSGTMGPTVVNISSGAQTRLSGMVEGVAALLAFLVLGSVLAWIPVAALAGILIVVGARMFDLSSLRLLRSRATVLDFAVIVAVVIVAECGQPDRGVGHRRRARDPAVHPRANARHRWCTARRSARRRHSKQARLPHEAAVLDQEGEHTAIFELQGSLFFGTADQLYTVLEPHLKTRRFLVLDMRRVQSVDLTAAHILELVGDMLRERGGHLLFSALPRNMPGGVDARRYLGDLGFYEHLRRQGIRRTRRRAGVGGRPDPGGGATWQLRSPQALALAEIDLFRGRSADTLAALAACVEARSYAGGERIFAAGDTGDELFLIRRGAVRIVLPAPRGRSTTWPPSGAGISSARWRSWTASRGRPMRSPSARPSCSCSRGRRFDQLADEHRRLGMAVLDGIARALALRLRRTDQELQALQAG